MFDLTVRTNPPYSIRYRLDPFSELTKILKVYANRKVALVFDTRVHTLLGERFLRTLRQTGREPFVYCFPSGEKYKTLSQVTKLLTFLLEKQWSRDDVIVAVGGGVTGDMGAFAASICLRGVPLIALPTTLLAQVDSSVGGKTGVNHARGKNLIGTFYQPKQVLISSLFLKTLEPREIQTGMAEVIKYAMIASPELYALLDRGEPNLPTEEYWEQMIRLCVTIKADVVSRDEKESSLRMILNYGHTFGHALESLTKYRVYTHGEAVAIGMNIAARVAAFMGFCDSGTVLAQNQLLEKYGLPVVPGRRLDADRLLEFMKGDKKVKNGCITLVLPEKVGKVRMETSLKSQDLKKMLVEILG